MICSLDIGTRTVVGIISEESENGIRVIDFETVEHEERAMLDGQINDIPKVSKAIVKVKKALEERNNIEFKDVSTAIAGRFLKTISGSANDKIPPSKIDEKYVKSIEFGALSDAISKNKNERDYCVGYTVLKYSIDGEEVRSLLGQLGEEASVSVIAAFLPERVVEALFSVVDLSNLSVNYLTLEPMAAMNLVVPKDLRRINIALVDVGAGTSDIAISDDGTIVAYGMIPMAGDEITEKICDEYLLSFSDGENVKRKLGSDEKALKAENILGIPLEIPIGELLKITDTAVNVITDEISKMILDLNSKVPSAVMVVGGGAKVPHFVEMLAEKLSLPKNRVALRNVENISNVEDMTKRMNGSEFITPVGIAYSARFNIGKLFKRMILNSRPIQIMNLTGREDILQALIQGGFDVKSIIGKPSNGITYRLNGEIKVVGGELPDPVVKINGKAGTLRSIVKEGDVVEVIPSDGLKTELKVKDISKPIKIFIDEKEIMLSPKIKVNSNEASFDEVINDGDDLSIDYDINIEDLFRFLNFNLDGLKIFVNGEISEKNRILRDGDRVEIKI